MANQFEDLTDSPLTIVNTLSNNTLYTNNFYLNQINSNHSTYILNLNSNSTINACKYVLLSTLKNKPGFMFFK